MKNKTLMFGFAETDITPSAPINTVGFGREDEMSRGILHPLSAQAVVWQLGEERCCVAAIDHIGFSKRHANALRDEIGKILNLPREKVMLCFSHCHSAPNESASPKYYRFVCDRIKNAAARALQNMVPVNAAWDNAFTDIGLNRRKGCDALDRRIGILKICDSTSGELKLLLLRLTAHNNVLKADNYLISPDYFGAVRDALSKGFGYPVMVTQGAAGNVAPRYFKSAINPPDAADERFIRSDTALENMAKTVLHDVKPVVASLHPQKIDRLSMYSRQITLAADVPPYPRAMEIADEARQYCGIDGTGWLEQVQHLLQNGIHQQTEDVEVQYFSLGNGCLCGVANEVMVEFALRVSKLLHDDFFYFGGYTNGCTGYFPTEEEFDKGGYEVYWSMLIYYVYHGRVFPLRRDSASELIRFVAENAPNV
jgi:hypothetical protein